MKNHTFTTLMIFVLLILLSVNVFAQTAEDAKKLMYEGNDLVNKGDYKGAMTKYEEAVNYPPLRATAL
jgi:hypothetical protein